MSGCRDWPSDQHAINAILEHAAVLHLLDDLNLDQFNSFIGALALDINYCASLCRGFRFR